MNTMQNVNSSYRDILVSHDSVLALVSGATNMILGLPLNSYVMTLIVSRDTLASDFFSFSLALSEILFSLFMVCYFVFDTLRYFPLFKAFMFSTGLLYTARPFFQCLICVDCYARVLHPVAFLRYKGLRYKVASSAVVWLLTFASCVYSMYTYYDTVYMYGFFLLDLLFLLVMLSCCLATLRALRLPAPGGSPEKTGSCTVKRRAFKTILFIMVTMALNFLLYLAAIPLQCCIASWEYIRSQSISISLALLVGFLQPLLYLYKNDQLTCFLHFTFDKRNMSEKRRA